MELYFFSIEYFSENVTGFSSGSLEINYKIKSSNDFNEVIKNILEKIEKDSNIKIGTNYKILAFNKI